MKKPEGHTLSYCSTTDKKISQSKQFVGRHCPYCDVVLPSRGEIADPNATVAPAVQFSTTDSIAGYRILRSHGIIYAQAPNRYQGLGTSGMDNKQARKTTAISGVGKLPVNTGMMTLWFGMVIFMNQSDRMSAWPLA